MDTSNSSYNSSFTPNRKTGFVAKLKKLFSRNPNSTTSSQSFGATHQDRSSQKVSKKTLVMGSLVFLVVIGLAAIFKYSVDASDNKSTVLGDQKIQLPNAKATHNINQEFPFPLRNEKGEEVSKLKFVMENAELRDEIVVKGQKATAIVGRTFLIINLKIVNEHNQAVSINTRDYLRLTVNNKDTEMLAPDIHNDPVEVQAISTKFTRVGFPINDSDKALKLHIGEIKGQKTTVDLTF